MTQPHQNYANQLHGNVQYVRLADDQRGNVDSSLTGKFIVMRDSLLSLQLALPHMRQIVMKRFGCSITIDLLEKLQLPPSSNSTNAPNQTTNHIQMNNVNVATNPSLLSQTHQQQQIHGNTGIQQASFNTVQVQQKINLVPQNTPAPVIGPTGSLLSQQQHQQLQARAQNVR